MSPKAVRGGVILPLVVAALSFVGGGCGHAAARALDLPPGRSRLSYRKSRPGVVALGTALDGDPSHVTLCSGALVAANLVLTARHCVSRAITSTPSCDARGRSHNGAHLADDADPAKISVYVGQHVRVDQDQPRAHGLRTLHPTGQVLLRRGCCVHRPRSAARRRLHCSLCASHAPVASGDTA